MSQETSQPQNGVDVQPKLPYRSPVLRDFGPVDKLTLGTQGDETDGAGGSLFKD